MFRYIATCTACGVNLAHHRSTPDYEGAIRFFLNGVRWKWTGENWICGLCCGGSELRERVNGSSV